VRTVTVNLPDRLYSRLKERAVQSDRTVEAELIEVLASAIPLEAELPPEIVTELASLERLDTSSLEKTARKRLSQRISQRLERLHLKQQREGLSEMEARELAELMRKYEGAMLLRARAVALLKQRGCDVAKPSEM
jgi:plasmid stability protein